MNSFSKLNNKLKEFVESVPAEGTHVSYLADAYELYRLYGKASSIMEEDSTPENEAKVEAIAKEVEEIVG